MTDRSQITARLRQNRLAIAFAIVFLLMIAFAWGYAAIGNAPEPKTTAALNEASIRMVDAFGRHDSKVVKGLMSDRCQDQLKSDAWVLGDGEGLDDIEIEVRSVSSFVHEDRGLVNQDWAYTATTSDIVAQPWVYEDGAWRWDDCD